jgi:hypothetical protein
MGVAHLAASTAKTGACATAVAPSDTTDTMSAATTEYA